jgi:hypothetical protein
MGNVSATVTRVWARLMLVWTVLLATAGCGTSSVSVPAQFPEPIVEKLPLSIGVVLDEALLAYSHSEELESGKSYHIELGSAQTEMFQKLLSGMFVRAAVVSSTQADQVDGVLVPSIEELQFSTPDQTKTDYFEVWIRYQMRLYEPDGTLVAEWPLTAYGQANSRNYNMQGQEPALQAAALSACRDAMAFFIVQFRTIPAVETWLAAKTGGPAA